MQSSNSDKKLQIFYDGDCPLCRAEMEFLERRDKNNCIGFVDVRLPHALEPLKGVSCEVALNAIHARTDTGEILTGIDAFCIAYQLTGLKLLAWILSRKSVRPILNYGYRVFARNRYSISRIWAFIFLKNSPKPKN